MPRIKSTESRPKRTRKGAEAVADVEAPIADVVAGVEAPPVADIDLPSKPAKKKRKVAAPEPVPEQEPEQEQEPESIEDEEDEDEEVEAPNGAKPLIKYLVCDENGHSLKKAYKSRSGPYAAAQKAANRLGPGDSEVIFLRKPRSETLLKYQCSRVVLEPEKRTYLLCNKETGKRHKLSEAEKKLLLANKLTLDPVNEKVITYKHKSTVSRVR